MEWIKLLDSRLSTNWQYSLHTKGKDFKVEFSYVDVNRNSIVLLALANLPSIGTLESTEFFKPQQIRPLVESEIIKFPDSPNGWWYRLAVKKLQIPRQPLSETEIKIYMPAYSSAPVFNGSTNTATPSTVPVDSTKSIILSALNANKIGTTVINNSTKGKLYVSIDQAASLTVYDKILNYLEVYETPFNWSGNVYGIWDKADATGNAKVKDFS